MFRHNDPAAYGLSVVGAAALGVAILAIDGLFATVLITFLALVLMLVGWIRQRHVERARRESDRSNVESKD